MKYRFVMAAAGMLLAIGACTLISAKNYAEDLAVVTLTSTAPNAIRQELTVEGEVFFEEISEIKLPAGCTVEAIFAGEGAWLKAEEPILRLKESDLQIAYYEMLLQAEGLEESAFTWSRWFFPNLTLDDGLREIDAYLQEYVRYAVTGRHYKGNYRIRYEQLKDWGYRSLVHEFYRRHG